MSEETRKRVAKLYREGKFQNDPVAEQWADEFFPKGSEKKEEAEEEAEPKTKKKK